MRKRELLLKPLIEALQNAEKNITNCNLCFNLDITNPCQICQDYKRDKGVLCITADVADLWAIERSQIYKGKFHVRGCYQL